MGLQGGLQGGQQVGLQGGPQGVLQGVLPRVESFQMDSGRGIMGQEWSGVVTLHLSPHNSKVKSHFKFSELDINASQACLSLKIDEIVWERSGNISYVCFLPLVSSSNSCNLSQRTQNKFLQDTDHN